MPTPEVFNLSWFSKPFADRENPAQVTRHVRSTLGTRKPIDAVILYPSLMTPAILGTENDTLELLILAQPGAEVPSRIWHQLKISDGLDPSKHAAKRDLFVGADGEMAGTKEDWSVQYKQFAFKDGEKYSTLSGRFSAYIDKRVYKIYSDAGYTDVYSFGLSNKCLEAAKGGDQVCCFPEAQDLIMTSVMDCYHERLKQGDYYYAYGESGGDVDFSHYDKKNPIQAWHPVFWYRGEGLQYANFAHVADVHMAARQQIMAKTTARVIDFVANGAETEITKSPHIGPLVNICSKDMIDIFDQFTDNDMLLVGGDLVDCLRSGLPSGSADYSTPKKVWDNLDLGDNYLSTYTDCIDMISFYGVVLKYCKERSKPAFLVSGNHDCYLKPFGISPRVGFSEGTVWHRANEGIPADHNLTIYEAILSFGETYHAIKAGLGSPFEASTFDWFYMVFTPFTDFSVEMPKQVLVGASWGDDEILINPSEIVGGQGFGHLPRAPEPITDAQMDLYESAVAKKKNVILMTHFTFVSYLESIPTSKGNKELGDVYCDTFRNYNSYNFGTFESKRAHMFQDHVGGRTMQVIVTGHSHRRALYLCDHVDFSGRNSIKTRHFDFPDFPWVKTAHADILRPAIIVSDSGGTIPRYNMDGEFFGWGSDIPSGTAVVFDPGSGEVAGVDTVRTRLCRPRAAVALDYMDVEKGERVIVRFESAKFAIDQELQLTELPFELELHENLNARNVYIREVSLFLKRQNMDWFKVDMEYRGPSLNSNAYNFAIVGFADVQNFVRIIAPHKDRGAFMAMKVDYATGLGSVDETAFSRYNFDDYWCFEFQVDYSTSGRGLFHWSPTHKKYVLERDSSRAEIPDFDWRRKCIPEKYS